MYDHLQKSKTIHLEFCFYYLWLIATYFETDLFSFMYTHTTARFQAISRTWLIALRLFPCSETVIR